MADKEVMEIMKKSRVWLAFTLAAALLLGGCSAPVHTQPADTQVPAAENSPVPEEAQWMEMVLEDNDSIRVSVTDYDPAADLGPTFTLRLENRTESSLYFTLNDVSVNDVMNDPLWGETVGAGQSVDSELYWFYQDLAMTGINYICEVEGILWVYDADDFSAEDTYEDAVAWAVDNGPADVPPVEEAVFSGGIEDMELFSTGEVTAIIKDYSPQGEWGPSFIIYLENSSESPVLFFMSALSINGTEHAAYWSKDVSAGKTAYSHCFFWQDDLEENEITDIRDMSFTFEAVEYDTWDVLAKVTATISLEGTGEILEKLVSGPQE